MLKKIILDILFPINCLYCQKPGEMVCQKCLSQIPIRINQNCPSCERVETISGRICQKCLRKTTLKDSLGYVDYLIATSFYNKNQLAKLIHLYKYRFLEGLSEPLGKKMAEALIKNDSPLPDAIIPVPLHKRRLRTRGFNQAQLLADQIAKNLTPGMEIPVNSNLLLRKKYTPPQMKIKSYRERLENLKNSFAINENIRKTIRSKHLLLIDDVSTTGSTLFECAKILRKNGAHKVGAVVLARQEID